MIVRDWMSPNVVLLPAETSLPEALRFVHSRDLLHVGVLRSGRIAGAVTRAQIYEALEGGDPFTLLSRKTLASLVPVSSPGVAADDPLDRAARLMTREGFAALPVVWENEIVGIVTLADVCRAFCRMTGAAAAGAGLALTLNASRQSDLLDEIRRRTRGLRIESLLAYPKSEKEWQVTLHLRPEDATLLDATA